jgi:tight adherence protein C
VIDLLVLCLSAGLDLPGALRHVVSQCNNPEQPLIEELGFVLQELTVGKTRKVALTQLAERLPFEPVREFVGAIIQAEEHGNPLARVLQIHAEVSRQQRTVRAEEAASRAGVKMMIPMVMIFAAILVVIIGPMALSVKDKF